MFVGPLNGMAARRKSQSTAVCYSFLRRLRYRRAVAETFLEADRHVRPTRHRLLVTMGISACLVAAVLALLGSIVDIVVDASGPKAAGKERLNVVVRDSEAQPPAADTENEQVLPPVVEQELTAAGDSAQRQEPVIEEAPEPPADVEPRRDWHAMKKDVARSSVADLFEEHESRVATWRRSHSMMFRPGDDFEVGEDEPFIPDFRFKPQIHVVGLGFTIGSCFIGIPLAGVPVEQRSVAVALFVCAGDAG